MAKNSLLSEYRHVPTSLSRTKGQARKAGLNGIYKHQWLNSLINKHDGSATTTSNRSYWTRIG